MCCPELSLVNDQRRRQAIWCSQKLPKLSFIWWTFVGAQAAVVLLHVAISMCQRKFTAYGHRRFNWRYATVVNPSAEPAPAAHVLPLLDISRSGVTIFGDIGISASPSSDVVEIGSEMTTLLDLSYPGELHSCVDLPERVRCLASRRKRQNPVGIERIRCLRRLTFGVADDGYN